MILNEFKVAVRRLVSAPTFALVVILTLALGIGANTAIFSVINAVLFRSLPYSDPDRLVMFWEKFDSVGVDYVPISEGNFLDWKERQQVFSDMAGFRIRSHATGRPVIVSGDWTPLRVNGVTCAHNLFETLGVKPLLGRSFQPGEDEPGAAPVAILSYGLWQRLFGGDVNVLGRNIELDGSPHEIIGVLREGFFFPPPLKFAGNVREGAADVFFPYPFRRGNYGLRAIRTVARLKPGVSIVQAEAALKPIAEQLLREHPDDTLTGAGVVILPLHEQAVDISRARLLLLAAAVGAVLLIACLNVANLLLARASLRKREIAVRAAMGASRAQIVRLLVSESLLLGLLGGLAGVLLAGLSLPLLLGLSSNFISQLGPVELDTTVLVFSLVLALLTGTVIGVIPAFRVSRPNLHEDLKEGDRSGSQGRRPELLRKSLVVAEVAAATVLLIGAGLMIRSLWKAQQVDLGFQTRQVMTVQTWLPPAKYSQPDRIVSFYRQLMQELAQIPEVEAVGAINKLPFSRGLFGGNFEIQGRNGDNSSQASQVADYRVVAGDYFKVLGIDIVAGRGFLPTDREDSQLVVLVDNGLAQRFWPDGQWKTGRIEILSDKSWRSIVGVVRQIRHQSIRTSNQGIIYVPLAQHPDSQMALVVAYRGEAPTLPGLLRQRVQALDPNVPIGIRPLDSYLTEARSGLRSPSMLLGLMAGLALILALVGLYGLIAFLMGRRSREIGIRLALGATSSQILRLTAGEMARLVGMGIVIGIVASLGLSNLLAGLLYGISAADPLTYAAVAVLFLAIAGLATYFPIRQACRLNPTDALRTE